MTNFVHLHVHTQYSLLDGAAEINRLLQRVKDLGMPAVAITDHGVMYGCLKFYQQALKLGVKPILGCEVYLAPRSLKDKQAKVDESPAHLLLLAETNQGYQNLLQLVSLAHLEGFYYKPRIDLELLGHYATGLIGCSSCLAGRLPTLIAEGKPAEAKAELQQYQRIFGRDNFFVELQYQKLDQQILVNQSLAKLAAECGAPLVATNDVHYLNRQDATVHDVLLCIQTGKTVAETERLQFATNEFYLKTPAEMTELWRDYPQAIANTLRIAERCQVGLELGQLHLPGFKVPKALTPEAYLAELCRAGIGKRVRDWDQTYETRLQFELATIGQMGFAGYFLIVQDFVNFAREQGIMVGPGRGSAAGSLVAYLLGITSLDPIEQGLLFERFLNPERISLPDIDIDFCFERRGEVIAYVRKRFGEDRVAQIITFGTMAARAAVRDVGRALGLPYGEVDRLAKLIPNEIGITLAAARDTTPEIQQQLQQNPKLLQLWEIAEQVEGFPRHASTHAAGVVISAEPLVTYLPLARSNEDEVITQFPMEDIEALGLLKMDFLGLRTLTVLRDTRDLIARHRQQTIAIEEIPRDDPLTYQQLQAGHTMGIFQLESGGISRLLMRLKPERLADLTALVALYRPGPLGSGMVDDFINGKHGQKKVTYLHPLLEPILKETYGVILYQEQVMQIASQVGGFSLAEADQIRRAMGKKKPEVLASLRQQFTNGAVAKGLSPAVAGEIFDLLEYFAGYGFNKSHSAAYGLVVYQTAYFKANYPQEYMAALLTSMIGNTDKITLYIEECRRMGLTILRPDVNHSTASFNPEGAGIRFGLLGIKNVGSGAIERIISERSRGTYHSFSDFCQRAGSQMVNKRVIESLIRAGALDFPGASRRQMLDSLEDLLELAPRRSELRNQLALMETSQLEQVDQLERPPTAAEFSQRELLQLEREYLGVYLSGHPLDDWREKFQQNGVGPVLDLEETPDGKEVLLGGLVTGWRVITTKSGNTMANFKLEDLTGTVEVVVFPQLYQTAKTDYQPDRVVLVKGRLERQDRGVKILAGQIRWL